MAENDSNPVPPRVQNIIGQEYGRRTVIGYSHAKRRAGGRGWRHYWITECRCGTITTVRVDALHQYISCGCYAREVTAEIGRQNASHGMYGTPEYIAWRCMISRCENPKHDSYSRYGGRGITICPEWRESFEAFYEDMGDKPSNRHSLDRIDNNGAYEPENVRWATQKQQANKRHDVRLITFRGETKTVAQWARTIGIKAATLRNRLDRLGWSTERALTEPVHKR